ncbi:MAG: SusC/RagA family TonB-linked outer membrane protein [Chitinophagaceae bacterium]|nr:SusC/RagA family TonB-linked outer membrane protein [Chitinophagaceae bacterium]
MKSKLHQRVILLTCFLLAFLVNLQAQRQTVSGIVFSESEKTPLAGVSVTVQGAATGTVTDEKGKYSISVSSGNVIIVFSFTGYISQTVNVNNRSTIDITLTRSDGQLAEVVVTAVGIERQKKSLGYSAQTVKGDELLKAREINVANSLQGKVAGVFVSPSSTGPGGSTYINIRGASSFTGNNQPLYVVDGVPIDNQTLGAPDLYNSKGQSRDYGDGIGNILADDIASVTVLKGPNAAALYGARGATGVILITTKKGSAGKKIGVDYTINATFEKPNVLPKRQNAYGPGYDDVIDYWYDATVGGQPVKVLPNWIPDMWGAKFDGRAVTIEQWPDAGVLKYSGAGDDNVSKFYRTGSTLSNTLAVSGSNDKANFRLSLNDLRNKGIYPTSKLDRQTINLKAGFNATDKLYVEGKINYIRQHGENRPGSGLDINTISMSLNRIPAFVSLDLLKNYKTADGQSNNWTDGRPFNPYWILYEMPGQDSRDRIIGYVLARYKFNNWLTLRARTGTDFYTDIRNSHIGVNTPTGFSNLRRGQVNNSEAHIKEENSDVLLTADGKLTNQFTGSFSVGANHLNRREEYMFAQGNNLNIDGIYNLANAGLVVASTYLERKQINSAYFTGQLGYKNYLFLDVSGRNDWSSTLGVNNYSFFYPSVSTSFAFTDAFSFNPKILSFGKLRVSYAQAGNDASPYRTKIGYYLYPGSFNGQQYAGIQGDIPLLDLKNELTGSVEVGTELRFLNNRIGLDLTYYNSSTKNQIVGINIPQATGFNSKLINAGEIRNQGIEILLTGTPVKTKNITWDVTLNLSRNRSKVISLAPGIDALTLTSTGEMSIEARPGLPYGNIVGYAFKRNPDGDKWLDDDGRYQQEDSVSVLGNIQPDFIGGLNNSFSYKGFTISVLVDFRKGGKIFSYSKQQQWSNGTGKTTENGENLISDGVILNSTTGKFEKSTKVVGRMNYYTSMSWGNIAEAFVLPADYAALREISVGYDVGTILKKSIFRTAKLSIVGRNLLYIYRNPELKLMGANPEGAYGPSTVAQGFETTGIPSTRSVGINLSFSF